jgi:DNA repair protein RecN (Recombination protein N)
MLTCLRVRNFAIIDRLELELGAGLNVVTGETGAGKSILVDALSLVLGARARPEVVRTGADCAEVEALFDLEGSPEIIARLEAAGIPGAGDAESAGFGELVVRRVVQASGRTRAYVNGRLATAAQLAEIAAGLADLSSQHEHHSLTDPAMHLVYLDAFARLEDDRTRMVEAYEALREAQRALHGAAGAERGREEREDLLAFQVREIDELAPVLGEKETLRAEREVLRHAERLARTAGGAEDALYGADGAVSELLARVANDVAEIARLDAKLAPFAAELADARARIEDVAQELGRYARGVTGDPERLVDVDERLDRLARAERKYGGSLEAVLAHAERARAELDTLQHHDEHVAALEAAREAAQERASLVARHLSTRRQEAALALGRAISDELTSVGMAGGRVLVAVTPPEKRATGEGHAELEVDGARLGPTGIDHAEFLLAPNRGEEPKALRRIASGGELSRALLAIKRVLAGLRPAGLYVFDEVDTGVGGAVAEVIGRKLKDVARHHQVLCITHLPQIAVHADVHFRVSKEVVDERTRSTVTRLDSGERREEVARMLGGVKVTAKTRAAAVEMLREAR